MIGNTTQQTLTKTAFHIDSH